MRDERQDDPKQDGQTTFITTYNEQLRLTRFLQTQTTTTDTTATNTTMITSMTDTTPTTPQQLDRRHLIMKYG